VIGSGTAERDTAIAQVQMLPRGRKTVGGDKGFDQHPFVAAVRAVGATPHVARKTACGAIDRRTTRHAGYAVSQRLRKRVEEIFGWMKTVGQLDKLRHRGVDRVNWMFVFTAAAYNLVRLRTLVARPA
jgi:IS5 family transposase